jgi:hypothetical protein
MFGEARPKKDPDGAADQDGNEINEISGHFDFASRVV